MAAHRVLAGITTAMLSVIALGCARPAADTGGVRLAHAGPSTASTAGLCGTWQGEFSYIGSDLQSSTGSSDLTLEVSGDSTYTLTWGNHPPSRGIVTFRENRLILDDESGSRITLVHSGDTLFGAMRDDGRPTMMSLAKQDSSRRRFAGTSPRC
jgi:hypothetical protein